MTDDQNITDPWWRLTNLYFIQDKYGNKVRFTPWPEQRDLYDNMWTLNIVLKARQRGMTTFIQLFMLDRCLFKDDTAAGIIAHNAGDAENFFDNKIKFAYDHLPEWLRKVREPDTSNTRELSFKNGSRISVGTSHRSGTLQLLHISEYGKLCAQFPNKAAEVRAGALNTIAPGNIVFIESTAEGRLGHFYELCMESQRLAGADIPLTRMDYKFHFYPWWGAEEYRLHDKVNIPMEMADYFSLLEREEGIFLDTPQRNWYVKKAFEQGEAMKPEYPSTPAEAFHKSLQGAIFANQLRVVREEQRITDVPHTRGEPVNVYWDLGYNDINAMWFQQSVGPWDHFVDYYEDRLVDMTHYIELLVEWGRSKGYQWGTMYLPHDGRQHHITAIAGTVEEILLRHGFRVRVVERPLKKVPSIEAARKRFPTCRFDKTNCEQGIIHLENYRWKWDEKGETYSKSPNHDAASNGADAFQTFGWWMQTRGGGEFAKQYEPYNPLTADMGHGYKRGGGKSGILTLKPESYGHIL